MKLAKRLSGKAKSVCALCAAIFLTQSAAIFAQQKITLKIASVAPTRSPWDVEQRKLAQTWAQVTDGTVNVQFFDAAVQGGEGGVIQKMRSVRPGQKPPLDGAVFTNIGVYDLAPESKIFTLCVPFMFRNQEEVTLIFNAFNSEMKKAVQDKGYVLLGWLNMGWAYFLTKERATTIEKLKSLRTVLGGLDAPELSAAFRDVGFRVENMAADKVSQSAKTAGGIESFFAVPLLAYAMRMFESLPYLVKEPLCPIFAALVINEKTWNEIPANYRTKMLAEVHKLELQFVGIQQETDKKYIDQMQKEGGQIVTLPAAERDRWERVFAQDAERVAGPKGSPIDKDFYTRVQTMLNEYRRTHDSKRM
ncbi:MAG: TRAP transporter substrate-binding protein DctP [Treponemataceae bacterium]|nr:MAG: TRAP transporter substrate-binding protein DctP [Treponemataceae bacterium]